MLVVDSLAWYNDLLGPVTQLFQLIVTLTLTPETVDLIYTMEKWYILVYIYMYIVSVL